MLPIHILTPTKSELILVVFLEIVKSLMELNRVIDKLALVSLHIPVFGTFLPFVRYLRVTAGSQASQLLKR